MNNVQTILAINDKNIAITMFSCENLDPIIRFKREIKLKPNSIINGCIADTPIVMNIISNLIKDATSFTGIEIKKIIVSIDVTDIKIVPFNMSVNLNNGMLNAAEWEAIKKSVNIEQGANKYIYDIHYDSWIVDNKKYHSVDSQIIGSKLEFEALMLQISKALYNQYLIIFDKLNIQVTSLRPLANDFVNTIDLCKHEHYEIFVHMEDFKITLFLTKNNIIKKGVHSMELGLNSLYNAISQKTGLNSDVVSKLLNQVWSYYTSLNDLRLIQKFSQESLDLSVVNIDLINEIITEYIKSVVKFIDSTIEILNLKQNIIIKKTSYVVMNKLHDKLFNFVSIFAHHNFNIMHHPFKNEYDLEFMQTWLLMNSIIKQRKKNKNTDSVSYKESKQIKEMYKE